MHPYLTSFGSKIIFVPNSAFQKIITKNKYQYRYASINRPAVGSHVETTDLSCCVGLGVFVPGKKAVLRHFFPEVEDDIPWNTPSVQTKLVQKTIDYFSKNNPQSEIRAFVTGGIRDYLDEQGLFASIKNILKQRQISHSSFAGQNDAIENGTHVAYDAIKDCWYVCGEYTLNAEAPYVSDKASLSKAYSQKSISKRDQVMFFNNNALPT